MVEFSRVIASFCLINPEYREESFVTFPESGQVINLIVYMEPKNSKSKFSPDLLEEKITKIFNSVEVEVIDFNFVATQTLRTLSTTSLLVTVRKYAPIKFEDLWYILADRFDFDERELKRYLDQSIRNDFILFQKKSKTYVLTLKALRNLGTTIGRNSPDVIRALEFGFKGD